MYTLVYIFVDTTLLALSCLRRLVWYIDLFPAGHSTIYYFFCVSFSLPCYCVVLPLFYFIFLSLIFFLLLLLFYFFYLFSFHFSVGINEQLRRGARPFFALENNWKKPLAVCLFAPISSTTHPQSKRDRNNTE